MQRSILEQEPSKVNTDKFLYDILTAEKAPVIMKLRNDRVIKGTIKGHNDKLKLILLSNDEIVEYSQIAKMVVLKKQLKKSLVSFMEDLFHLKYFDTFKGKDLYINYIKGKGEKAKFKSFQKYQLIGEQKGNLVLYYKIAISTFSFINPYPRNLIEYTGEKEIVRPGKWREEYKYIEEVWQEEIIDDSIYKVELALKDGRNITGYLKKNNIFPSNIRLFENPNFKGKSIFVMNHSIADVLDIVRH